MRRSRKGSRPLGSQEAGILASRVTIIPDPVRQDMVRIGVRERDGPPWTWTVIDAPMAREMLQALGRACEQAEAADPRRGRAAASVPRVAGIDVDAAKQLLESCGATVDIAVEESADAHDLDNRVHHQHPPAGSPLRHGQTIQLTITARPSGRSAARPWQEETPEVSSSALRYSSHDRPWSLMARSRAWSSASIDGP